jgi:hypothetical protein
MVETKEWLQVDTYVAMYHKYTYKLCTILWRILPPVYNVEGYSDINLPRVRLSDMFPMFRGWSLRILAVVTYETATRSVAVDKQWTVYISGFGRHATIYLMAADRRRVIFWV